MQSMEPHRLRDHGTAFTRVAPVCGLYSLFLCIVIRERSQLFPVAGAIHFIDMALSQFLRHGAGDGALLRDMGNSYPRVLIPRGGRGGWGRDEAHVLVL